MLPFSIDKPADNITGAIVREQRLWEANDSIAFFSHNRHRREDLYPSEKNFLPRVVKEANSVLDVGCACGGFAQIMKGYNPSLTYSAIDIVPTMIEQARQQNPTGHYTVAAGHALPFGKQTFDLVHCSGVVHLNSSYEMIISEMWRVSAQYLLFDMRLTDSASQTGTFKVDFGAASKAASEVLPYHLVNSTEARNIIEALPAPPEQVEVFAYYHAPSANSSFDASQQILMAFFLLHRQGDRPGWHLKLGNALNSSTDSQ
ncbi:class I SAM-dependent methyltransferase [Alphaproteobacteria bacterium]|nr:class I SAM-dependent methyltransferase [Alphaproteobacteria bacterium]